MLEYQQMQKNPQTNKTLTKLNAPTPPQKSSLSNTVLCIISLDHWSESLMQIPQTGKQVWENTALWERCPGS